jgi:hypothetical protein
VPHTPETDPLDTAIDAAVERLTTVERLEGPSRARVLARLAESAAEPDRRAWRAWASARTWRPAAVATSAALGLVIVVAALMLVMNTWRSPSDAPRVARDEPAAPPPAAATATEAPPPAVTTRRDVRSDRGPRADAEAPPRTRAPRRRTPTPALARTAPARPDPLASLIRDLQRLPQEVWDRAEAAGPPVVSELTTVPPAPIAPLEFEQLLDAEVLTVPSALTFPGESR